MDTAPTMELEPVAPPDSTAVCTASRSSATVVRGRSGRIPQCDGANDLTMLALKYTGAAI